MTQDDGWDAVPSWNELKAWREGVLDVWDSLPDRPGPEDFMALGNALRAGPAYIERRHRARVEALEEERDRLLRIEEAWRKDGALKRVIANAKAEALEEQAEAFAQRQTLRVSMELQDAADEKRRQAEGSSDL